MCRDTFSEKSLFHFEPSQVSFVLILSSMSGCLQARHAFIFPRNTTWPKNDVLLRRKTCALLRAKTSALLRRKTCAVLRARTCALLRANTKEAAFGRLHKGGRPSAAPLCGFLYMMAWEVASIAKTYRRISKYALNMYFDVYISHIPSKSHTILTILVHLHPWSRCRGCLVLCEPA